MITGGAVVTLNSILLKYASQLVRPGNCYPLVRRGPGSSWFPRMYHDGASTGLVLRVALWLLTFEMRGLP